MNWLTPRSLHLLLAVAGSILFSLALFFSGALDSWQERILDRFFLKKAPPNDIVIIGVNEESIAKIGQWPWPRHVFADVIEYVDNARIIGVDIVFSEPSRAGEADDMRLRDSIANSRAPIVLAHEADLQGNPISLPIPALQSLVNTGFVNVTLDYDNIARRASARRGRQESFANALIETSETPAEFRIDYQGKEGTFPIFSFSDVLEQRIPGDFFQGKTVLIGITAPSFHDTVDTPFGPLSGVEFHANVLTTIRNGRYFTETSPITAAILILFVCAAVFFAVWFFKKITLQAGAFVALFVILSGTALFAFSTHYILPILYLVVAQSVTVFGVLGVQYAAESKEKQFIRKSFQYYLTPDVIEELVVHPKKLSLGGTRREMAVLFSDIRGFTSISEKLTPEELTALLNEYLTEMTDIIMDHHGVVDKYIGDAVMAFWGAPLQNLASAADACRAAIFMIKKLRESNIKWQQQKFPHVAMGVGINFGQMIVGNMGSQRRFNYTIMGDEVNFASRLEGLTKYYGVACLISESIVRAVEGENEFLIRHLDTVLVKGKKEPRKIYELAADDTDKTIKKVFILFAKGRKAYQCGDWDKAIKKFQEALAVRDDGPSCLLLERSQTFKEHPPIAWEGVYEFKEK